MPNVFSKIMKYKLCEKEINYSCLNPRNWTRAGFGKFLRFWFLLFLFLAAFIIVKDEYNYQFGSDDFYSETAAEDEGAACNVQGVAIQGELVTYISPEDLDESGNLIVDKVSSEDIVYYIEQADRDINIKAIFLEVDSYGSSAMAGEEINQAIKKANKPVVVLVRSAATSAAYWAVSGTDIVFASGLSDIGGRCFRPWSVGA